MRVFRYETTLFLIQYIFGRAGDKRCHLPGDSLCSLARYGENRSVQSVGIQPIFHLPQHSLQLPQCVAGSGLYRRKIRGGQVATSSSVFMYGRPSEDRSDQPDNISDSGMQSGTPVFYIQYGWL